MLREKWKKSRFWKYRSKILVKDSLTKLFVTTHNVITNLIEEGSGTTLLLLNVDRGCGNHTNLLQRWVLLAHNFVQMLRQGSRGVGNILCEDDSEVHLDTTRSQRCYLEGRRGKVITLRRLLEKIHYLHRSVYFYSWLIHTLSFLTSSLYLACGAHHVMLAKNSLHIQCSNSLWVRISSKILLTLFLHSS